VLLATGAVVVLGTVIGLGLYPVSMIGVTGQTVQNTSPPTVALLALAGVQAGLLLTVAPAVSGWLHRSRGAHRLVIMNQNALALYLWHMAPVVVVALACYPTGWAPQPDLGSGSWWLCRLAWVGVLAVVTAAVLGLLWWGRAVFAQACPTVDIPLPRAWSQPLLVAGTAAAVCALWRFSAHGFAPDGRFPVTSAVIYAAGVSLVSLNPIGAGRSSTSAETADSSTSFAGDG
jgi:hypothetical protein